MQAQNVYIMWNAAQNVLILMDYNVFLQLVLSRYVNMVATRLRKLNELQRKKNK